MKTRRLISLLSVLVLLLSFAPAALAEEAPEPPPPEEGPVIELPPDYIGHWAEETLIRAMDDGLIQGDGDGSLRPDDPITGAEMITVLTRVFNANVVGETGVSPEAWYYDAARSGVSMGLIGSEASQLDAPMVRQDAFWMLARAFSLAPALPSTEKLDGFSDAPNISAKNRPALAALVNMGLLEGHGGYLHVDREISRAEFLAVLYRVAGNFVPAAEVNSSMTGGAVVSGDAFGRAALSYGSFTRLWFDCGVSSLSLLAVEAETLSLKASTLTSLDIGSGTRIGRLVLDCAPADTAVSIDLGALNGASIDTLQIQQNPGVVITDSVIKSIEITGDNQSVVIGGAHKQLIITGSNNKVTLLKGARFESVSVAGSGNALYTENAYTIFEEGYAGEAYISGALNISGEKNQFGVALLTLDSLSVSGSGHLNSLCMVDSPMKSVSIGSDGSDIYLICGDVESIGVGGNDNSFSKASYYAESGEIDNLTVSGDRNRINLDETSSADLLSVSGESNTFSIDANIGTATIDGRKNILENDVSDTGYIDTLTLNATGCEITVEVGTFIDNSRNFDVDRILELVSHTYQGDHTTEWALNNDYEDYEKEIWVNARGYGSGTEYLLWVNLAMQRVNIFKGSEGSWELIRTCLMGSGEPGRGTPVGVYYTTYKLSYGWTTASYTCRPVVGFKENSGYAFHSRLYYPNSDTLSDASIGFPVSLGCIRMYDEDINYIYDYIPLYTTVVVY
jgi:hypothetical protein